MLAKTYRIETRRLIIRCYQPKDAKPLKKAVDQSIDHLMPWMPWAKHEPETLQKKIAQIRKWRGQFDLGEDYTFGIFDKEERTLVGSTGLHTRLGKGAREIGYWIHVDYLRSGYATEAVTALTKVGFEIERLDRIEIHCSPDNTRSLAIPEKLGYLYEGTRENVEIDAYGNTGKAMIWTLFKEEYEESPSKSAKIKAFTIAGEPILMR